jgi:phosphoglycolate phosphatase
VTAEALAAILRRSPVILLDFDGPVCSVFAGYPAQQITEELRALAIDQVGELPTALDEMTSPHEFLTIAAEVSPKLARQVEAALQTAEIKAVESATPTPGVDEFLAACREAGRPSRSSATTPLHRSAPTSTESAWPISSSTSRPETHPTLPS